jgi:hypothetical protein
MRLTSRYGEMRDKSFTSLLPHLLLLIVISPTFYSIKVFLCYSLRIQLLPWGPVSPEQNTNFLVIVPNLGAGMTILAAGKSTQG